MTILKKIWNFLLLAEKTIMIIASLGVVALIVISVIMRYILEKDFGGMEELIVMIAFWIYFMGAAYGSYEESHITADILSVFMEKERTKLIVAFLRNVITAIILFAASYCAVELAIYNFTSGALTTVLKLPMSLVYAPIILGIFLMNLYAVVHSVTSAKALFGHKREEAAV